MPQLNMLPTAKIIKNKTRNKNIKKFLKQIKKNHKNKRKTYKCDLCTKVYKNKYKSNPT